MAITPKYLPTNDEMLDLWATNFLKQIRKLTTAPFGAFDAAPTYYSAVDLASMDAKYALWHPAFLECKNREDRSGTAVTNKDKQKREMVFLIRQLARKARGNFAIADAIRDQLGLPPLTAKRDNIFVLPPAPIVKVVGAKSLIIQFDYSKIDTETRDRTKPPGAKGIQGRATILGLTNAQPGQDVVIVDSARTPFKMQFPAESAGLDILVQFRWVMSRNRYSTWSGALALNVPNLGA